MSYSCNGHVMSALCDKEEERASSSAESGVCVAGVSRAVGNLGGPGAIHAVLGLATHKVSHTRKK